MPQYHAPMGLRIFRILSALSLALCVATCVLWVRSYFVRDFVITSTSGPVLIGWVSGDGNFGSGFTVNLPDANPPFLYQTFYYYISWVAAFGMLPFVWLLWWAVERELNIHDPDVIPCQSCGYDLRATPKRCPECGMVPL